MKLLFDAAITCGTGPVVREERCRGILVNPFQGLEIPNYPQHATRHDTKQALTHPQLEALEVEMPGWARVAPILGAYGMLRPGELLGAERSMILWPTRADDLGGGIVIKKTWHVDGQLLEYGKNDHATDNPIRLPDFVMEALRRHVDEWVSKPMPDRCLACADGVGENWDPTYANPHTRCGFADDAPLFTMPSTGRRPSRCHFAAIFASAADAAGLRIGGFLPSPHILRLSGAIAYLQIGRAPNEVCRMGRWESDATLLRFYNKPNAKAFADAARAVDAAARAGRGMEGGNPITDAERIAVLEARIEYLESRNAAFIDAFGDLPEPDRGRAGFPKSSFTDEEFLEAVAGATAEHEVALRLGRPNIRSSSLRLRAELLGVKLPPKRID
jgi:hypothetical protein